MNFVDMYNTIKAHWPQILAVLAALHTLLGAVNALIPPGKLPAWLRFIVDRLGALPQQGMKGKLGRYSPPFCGSRKMTSKKRKGDKNMKMRMFLPFVVIGTLLATSCATVGGQALKACELAQLSQIEQTAATCAIGALAGVGDWRAQLTACGTSLLPAQLNCVVAAIVAAADRGGSTFKASIIVQRGQQWLSENVGNGMKACR